MNLHCNAVPPVGFVCLPTMKVHSWYFYRQVLQTITDFGSQTICHRCNKQNHFLTFCSSTKVEGEGMNTSQQPEEAPAVQTHGPACNKILSPFYNSCNKVRPPWIQKITVISPVAENQWTAHKKEHPGLLASLGFKNISISKSSAIQQGPKSDLQPHLPTFTNGTEDLRLSCSVLKPWAELCIQPGQQGSVWKCFYRWNQQSSPSSSGPEPLLSLPLGGWGHLYRQLNLKDEGQDDLEDGSWEKKNFASEEGPNLND